MSPSSGDDCKDLSTICLFDMDGTLTKSRNKIEPEMVEVLAKLRKKCLIGLVSGSDLRKANEQMGFSDDNILQVTKQFDLVFTENGLLGFKNGEKFFSKDIVDELGEDYVQNIINFCLGYMSTLKLPAKRGTFIEFRTGMINICPVGRSCSQKERDQFVEIDEKEKIREKFIEAIYQNFPNAKFKLSIGGQISIDCFPIGWDKSYVMNHLKNEPNIKNIHFFGDKTSPGGNDYELFISEGVIGHTVISPSDTIKQLNELFSL